LRRRRRRSSIGVRTDARGAMRPDSVPARVDLPHDACEHARRFTLDQSVQGQIAPPLTFGESTFRCLRRACESAGLFHAVRRRMSITRDAGENDRRQGKVSRRLSTGRHDAPRGACNHRAHPDPTPASSAQEPPSRCRALRNRWLAQ
jgi:hypothetical protein